ANMLEGGGKMPILTPSELEDIGYKVVAYPLSLMGISIRAMEDALVAIKGGHYNNLLTSGRHTRPKKTKRIDPKV
ncbi:phosphoenolpyruvate carboxylase family protein, partial [Tanacetum coccineum]